ncbi:phage tail protein [Aliivibrio sp. S4TY2]|uniref:phage tail protein n=1 Tax=unclassified Aliivibrio TaxID=2645654 RepID=UPI0023783A52|nr:MULTISPECIES: phage tail protein [unclassified Aliivibrio]MDD9157008.1 phage tail protein [Aliivibrio sp. S4TY2]MDD9160778.1 phage tail protein [Aliivibrio sp. S4TY1]MDD9164807.1 phage tail protein [Aliivibrio sp. S4MY2]MDD9168918.1 phage tail protein [Aliivibrio sp. S4MY4]MDD9185446.1 phage tail protein [Aliivibrio sp. S4MY3]
MADMIPIQDFELNGAEVIAIEPLPSMGPLAQHVVCLVGTAPNKHAGIAYNEPVRLFDYPQAKMMLDTTNTSEGTLPLLARYLLGYVRAVFYVIVVEEGVDKPATETNIIGGVDANTGATSGLFSIKGCPETPTLIGAPGFNSIPFVQKLCTVARDIHCRPIVDGPNTNDTEAAEFAGEFGAEGTGQDKLSIIDPWFIKTYDGLPTVLPASIALISAMAAVEGYESPQNQGVLCDEPCRLVTYKIGDKTTQANFLNKHGVTTMAKTRMGGVSIIGNRTNTGRFMAHVGLEDLMVRKLEETSQPYMGKLLTEEFMDSVVERLSNWGQSLVADGVIPVFRAYLHPSKNNLENYNSGRWFLCVDYGRYSPNEHMVYEMSVDNGLIEQWLEEVVNG